MSRDKNVCKILRGVLNFKHNLKQSLHVPIGKFYLGKKFYTASGGDGCDK